MLIVKTIKEISEIISTDKKNNKKIAFVPTMGALHIGHFELVKKARELADIVIVSLFVNKAQFNDYNDYQKYPRQITEDIANLEKYNVDYVFVPDEKEIYPPNFAFKILVEENLADCLCGLARVGHFNGVALIIVKLFNIIKPDFAIFGEKDFQQLLIIRKIVEGFNFNIEIIGVETIREKSGLAFSSRNQRLDEDSKIKASNIYKILSEIKSEIKKEKNIAKILEQKKQEFLYLGFEKIDYLEVRNEDNLDLINNFDIRKKMRIFVALYLQGVRLIDNLKI